MTSIPSIAHISRAYQHMNNNTNIIKTRLEKNQKLSDKYEANIFLKREDMQLCRSFKIRGAFNAYKKLKKEELQKGVIIASDGNFCNACAFLANDMKVHTYIFLTTVVSSQKIEQVKDYGKDYITIIQEGENFEESFQAAKKLAQEKKLPIIHSFENDAVIEGNGTIAMEIINQQVLPDGESFDYCFTCVGGGGLAAGLATGFDQLEPDCKVVGIEPENANSMQLSYQKGSLQTIDNISRFCDGSSVRTTSQKTFDICKKYIQHMQTVSEGQIATSILQLYDCGLIVEPSGALAVAGLEQNREMIKGKNIVCIVSGGNTDLARLDTFKEIALIHEGLKHFFLINFPTKNGILRDFIKNCLSETDEISHIQFNKKADREKAAALIAIETKNRNDVDQIQTKMNNMGLKYQIVNNNKELYDLLV